MLSVVRIAFVTLNAYDILTGGHGGTAGGAQLQQSLIARELVKRGHDVYFVEHESDLKTEPVVDGIEIVTKPKPEGSAIRRAVEATSGTISVLREINPDACYFRVLDFEMFPILAYCKLLDSRFVYGFSHDNEVTESPNTLTGPIKGSRPYLSLTRKGLSEADALIAQNQFQYKNARRLFDTETHLIPNGYVDPETEPTEGSTDCPAVLWVSRFRTFKRPEIVLELAEEIPDADFTIIGSENNAELYDRVSREAGEMDNVNVVGYVPYEEINAYFQRADVFLNTSESEGFPNTFLQAWAYRTPVFSLDVNPNDILSKNEIGGYADGSVDKLVELVQGAVDDGERRRKMGDSAYAYFRANHSIESVTDRYEQVFEDVQ